MGGAGGRNARASAAGARARAARGAGRGVGGDDDAWSALEAEAGLLQQVGLLDADEARRLDDRLRRAAGLPTAAEEEAIERATSADLLDVLLAPPGDGALQVIEVCRFPGALHIAYDAPGRVTVSDDLGTAYAPCLGGRDGQLEVRAGAPSGARVLRIAAGRDVVEVTLP
ncbi:MAG TPA: hypothetical protein VIL49_14250 [Capillimicrobium sp.]